MRSRIRFAGQQFDQADAIEPHQQIGQLNRREPVAVDNPFERPAIEHTDGGEQQRGVAYQLPLLFLRQCGDAQPSFLRKAGQFQQIDARQVAHLLEPVQREPLGGELPLDAAEGQAEVLGNLGVSDVPGLQGLLQCIHETL